MSSSTSGGEALDAGVAINGEAGRPASGVAGIEVRQQVYLDDVADAAERALEHVQQTIADLQESLPERQAEAERALAEADHGQTENGRVN